jgi:hypothetical protein
MDIVVYWLVGFAVGAALVFAFMRMRTLNRPAIEATPPTPPQPTKPSGAPLRILTLLQSEARLFDFLMEDISGVEDKTIGAAVKSIQAKAQAALKQHLVLEPVMAESEGSNVTIPAGFDPSAVRVLGNVTGSPPFTGQLQHAGWRVKEIKLAAPAAGVDEFVIQPAEVQLN